MLKAEAGGGASFAIGDKVLTFAPETVAQTVTHFSEIRQLLNEIISVNVDDLAGAPAGEDDVSAQARANLVTSVRNLHTAISSGTTGMFEVAQTIRTNGQAYMSEDHLPSNGQG